ncbi:MAG: fasciclin domain-containing protein [Coprobacter sp.]|nr:fasciclin domain-containing protein [Coprobacter sp.]
MKIKKYLTGILLSALALTPLLLSSCKDDYEYDDKEPDNLGASIYDYLQENGEFTYFVRLIDDLEYRETLSKTGSKTLFPAKDEAFARFFESNPYGVSNYDELSPAQKRGIMNASMVNMAYLSDMLPNTAGSDGATKGQALRRNTESTYLDSVTVLKDEELFANSYWSRFAGSSLLTVQANPMIVLFTEQLMETQGITKEDFALLHDGMEFQSGDITVNGIRVIQKDILCKNGYIHVLEDVMLPSQTMADAIADAPEAKLFNKLMNKFSAPYWDENTDTKVHEYYNGSTPLRPLISTSDSVFVKGFFNEGTHTTDPNGKSLSSYGMLYYDPAANSWGESDMGTMFVPTDDAMASYLDGGKGQYLKDAYGSWDSIPSDILAMFIKNHQKRSFMASLPHSWDVITDETSYEMDIKESDVERCLITNNGAVFIVNTVLPPIDYQGVYASVLTAENTQIMKWAITDDWNDLGDTEAMRFYMYLRSMENMYNLLVPTDEALQNYREPISWARGGANREIWEFKYDKTRNLVTADVYRADEVGNKGAFLRSVTEKRIIRNRLRDIIDMHIIVGDNSDGVLTGYVDDGTAGYFLTKGGATIAVSGTGENFTANGGGDMEMGLAPAVITLNEAGEPCRYDSDNGRTFMIDHILHDPAKTVYQVLSENPDYKAFFDLCLGNDIVLTYFENDTDVEEIFSAKIGSSTSGVGMVVNSFNNFRYTVFVPTAEALEAAFKNNPKLYTWDEIAADENPTTKKEKTLYLLKFLRNHFIDNSIYITGKPFGTTTYYTGARTSSDKFHKVTVSGDGQNLTITDDAGRTATVLKDAGLYNMMARDIITDNADYTVATGISASSRAVIHQIDNVLNFE